ncbi:MAG TPA: hypothetical protein VD927_06355 [Chryseosolibacter sp.]|nr:hypothetical protein [Chryseosolibacter sp.]
MQNPYFYKNIGQNAMSGLSAGAAHSNPQSDFTVDPYAGLKGSAQGLAQGGWIGAIVGGATAQFGQFKKINENLDKLQTGVEGVTYDAYGRPVYQGHNILEANQNSGALDKGISKLNDPKNLIDPITSLTSTFTGTRRKMKRKRDAIQRSVALAQSDFNKAEQDFRGSSNQREDYLERMNNNNRMYNLYRNGYYG